MGKDPAFLFYSSDFLSGCLDLDMEERGQYITLLCAQHQKGHLSEKTCRLLVGLVSDSVLLKFSKDDNNLFFSERLDLEIQKRLKYTESKRKNGFLGGRPKKETYDKPIDKPIGYATNNLAENENINENETVICIDKEKGVKKFETPNLREIQIYVLEKYPDGNFKGAYLFADKFWSFYENNGWKVGKHKMKSWKLAIASWSDTLQKDLFPANSGNPKNLNNDYENSKLKRLTDQKEEGRLLIEKLYADKHSNQ